MNISIQSRTSIINPRKAVKMNRSAEFLRFLLNILTSTPALPLFLIADEKTSYQVAVPPEALGGNPQGVEIVFRQGRSLAQQHKHLCRNKGLLAVQITLGTPSEGEAVLVSLIDQKTGNLNETHVVNQENEYICTGCSLK